MSCVASELCNRMITVVCHHSIYASFHFLAVPHSYSAKEAVIACSHVDLFL